MRLNYELFVTQTHSGGIIGDNGIFYYFILIKFEINWLLCHYHRYIIIIISIMDNNILLLAIDGQTERKRKSRSHRLDQNNGERSGIWEMQTQLYLNWRCEGGWEEEKLSTVNLFFGAVTYCFWYWVNLKSKYHSLFSRLVAEDNNINWRIHPSVHWC